MLPLVTLEITQQTLRYADKIDPMIEFVQSGGFWTQEALADFAKRNGKGDTRSINITVFEDGRRMLHDGLHRCTSTLLAGRQYLREDEYELNPWTYESYLTPNFELGFVTPFDPRTEVRVEDWHAYKAEVMAIAAVDKVEAAAFISRNRDRYCRPKTVLTVGEVAAIWMQSMQQTVAA